MTISRRDRYQKVVNKDPKLQLMLMHKEEALLLDNINIINHLYHPKFHKEVQALNIMLHINKSKRFKKMTLLQSFHLN